MRLKFKYTIPFDVEKAWQLQRTPRFLIETSRPILKIVPTDPLPKRWETKRPYKSKLLLFGFIPWSEHTITFSKYSDVQFEFETNESGGAIRKWAHKHRMIAVDKTQCRGEDVIDFEAGIMGPFVWIMSQLLYRLRHRAWKGVDRLLPS